MKVGVNVPNASVMVIENSERFGLAQLHQLRGRVGRGEYQSYCILKYDSHCSPSRKRKNETMQETNDGFVIAEKDLELRAEEQESFWNQTTWTTQTLKLLIYFVDMQQCFKNLFKV